MGKEGKAAYDAPSSAPQVSSRNVHVTLEKDAESWQVSGSLALPWQESATIAYDGAGLSSGTFFLEHMHALHGSDLPGANNVPGVTCS